MDRADRDALRVVADELGNWVAQAGAAVAARQAAAHAADTATAQLRARVVPVVCGDDKGWHVLPLRTADAELLRATAREAQSRPSAAEDAHLQRLTADVPTALGDAKALAGVRRLFSGRNNRNRAQAAAEFLIDYQACAQADRVPEALKRLSPEAIAGAVPQVEVADALAEWVGLRARLGDLGTQAEVVESAVGRVLLHAVTVIRSTPTAVSQLRTSAVSAGEAVRHRDVRDMLEGMPVDRLRETTRERLRIDPLVSAGIGSVQAVIDREQQLRFLPGIGETTARRISAAARTLQQLTHDEMPVRIDINRRTPLARVLLGSLGLWDGAHRSVSPTDEIVAAAVTPLASALDEAVTHLAVFTSSKRVCELAEVLALTLRRGEALAYATSPSSADPWVDFFARPADYFAMLAELGFIVEDEQKVHGDLPEEIVEAVRALELKTTHLRASLRGYQSFGARFALVQRKVILGDEMGLGKTVEALAALAHLRAEGDDRFLVICPAAVVTNWIREIRDKSTLEPHRAHGPYRSTAVRNWVRGGGVAITTFDSLGWLESQGVPVTDLGCVVVDEAHYIKHPATLRTQRTVRILEGCERVLFLTGTPLENKLEEFRTLVGYLRPDLIVDRNEFAPRRFRRQVAPAYLRRNQEDVLTELPELVEVDEWMPMSSADAVSYRDAVADGNFMAMRQAAMLTGEGSEKLARLVEIVGEAEDNNRKVIAFSHFRAVLGAVAGALPGAVYGPLTGSVRADIRQKIVDDFSAAEGGAVLVAQIVAGGVGLNIQAASVVVICEPQVKPTTEWQAIARAHRMGQLQSVQVHRLLSEEGVDQRITEIVARKREVFEEFARVSDTAQSAPEAFDISEAELAREVLAAERQRLFGVSDPS